ncbi:MAG TPA: zeta toxin family protein [Pyrinomonadaceae bacterium]
MSVARTPRLRMFAGPNGSGKSTIKSYVGRYITEELFGHYINPDEFEGAIRRSGHLDFKQFNLEVDEVEILNFFRQSLWLAKVGLAEAAARLKFRGNRLDFSGVEANSYLASVASDFVRRKLLLSRQTFTFETVMSSPDKVEFLAEARRSGYRTYLYYVATEDPAINISRVENRVRAGGHDVPADKITARYHRSLGLLWEAVIHANRAYIFDNSSAEAEWVAEITDAERLEIKTDNVPAWFSKLIVGEGEDGV